MMNLMSLMSLMSLMTNRMGILNSTYSMEEVSRAEYFYVCKNVFSFIHKFSIYFNLRGSFLLFSLPLCCTCLYLCLSLLSLPCRKGNQNFKGKEAGTARRLVLDSAISLGQSWAAVQVLRFSSSKPVQTTHPNLMKFWLRQKIEKNNCCNCTSISIILDYEVS